MLNGTAPQRWINVLIIEQLEHVEGVLAYGRWPAKLILHFFPKTAFPVSIFGKSRRIQMAKLAQYIINYFQIKFTKLIISKTNFRLNPALISNWLDVNVLIQRFPVFAYLFVDERGDWPHRKMGKAKRCESNACPFDILLLDNINQF